MNLTILALDLGTQTGWALRSCDETIASGTESFKPHRFEGGGMRFLRFKRWLAEVKASADGLDAVYFEEVHRHAGIDAAPRRRRFITGRCALACTAIEAPSMKGIHCALQGRLGQDVELRRSANGKDWCRLSVGVGEVDELTWVSVSCFKEKAAAVAGLLKGTEVYVEGRLSLNTWTGKDDQQRTGLQVTAWEVKPLGRIGHNRPRQGSNSTVEKSYPFNDRIPF